MEYRTDEQYQEIVESTINGNWSQSYEQAHEYGFWAQDLINKHEDLKEEGMSFEDETNLALVVEGTMKIRAMKNEL